MKRDTGFTLMELMVIIAIIAILSAISIPNVISWRNNAQINSAARDFYSNIQLARSMAIKENMNCSIVFDEAGNSYIIFMENPARANLQPLDEEGDEKRVIKRVQLTQYGAIAFESIAFDDNDAGVPAISFLPNGLPINADGDPADGEVILRGASMKRIELTPLGNARIEPY